MPTELLINPPVGYPVSVPILGCLAILLGLGLPVLVRRWAAHRARVAAYPIDHVRAAALADLERIGAAHDRGELPAAAAYRQLAQVVREFAGTASDSPVEGLTLAELREHALRQPRLEPVSRLVAEIYPSAFSGTADAGPGVRRVVDDARAVITGWH